MSVSGSSRYHDQLINKVSVIGGGDLGMASVMSILSKVIYGKDFNWYFMLYHIELKCQILIFVFPIFTQCQVGKLVFIDVAESSTKGGSTDLEIFSLPKVEVSRGASVSALSHVSNVRSASLLSHRCCQTVLKAADWHCAQGVLSLMARLYRSERSLNPKQLLFCGRPWTSTYLPEW